MFTSNQNSFTYIFCTDKERSQNSEYVESAIQPLIELLRQPNVEDDIISSTCDEIYEKLDSGETITLFVPYNDKKALTLPL